MPRNKPHQKKSLLGIVVGILRIHDPLGGIPHLGAFREHVVNFLLEVINLFFVFFVLVGFERLVDHLRVGGSIKLSHGTFTLT